MKHGLDAPDDVEASIRDQEITLIVRACNAMNCYDVSRIESDVGIHVVARWLWTGADDDSGST